MRIPIWKRVLFVLVSVGLIVSVAFYFLAKQYAKPLLSYQLTRIFQKPVSVRAIKILPPVGISFRDFKVEGIVEAEAVTLQLIWPNIFNKEWFIREVRLENPTVYVVRRTAEPSAAKTEGSADKVVPLTPSIPAAPVATIFGKDWNVKVVRLTIQDGKFIYQDVPRDMSVRLGKFYLTIRSLTYPPRSNRMNFAFHGDIESSGLPFTGSHAEGRGWLNWPRRDMEADIVFNTAEGKKILSAEAQAQNNQLMVKGRMKMSPRLFKSTKPGEELSMTGLFASAVRAAGVEVDMGFQFQTLLDQFAVDRVSFSGNFGYSVPAGEALKKFQEKVLAPPANATMIP